MGPRVSTERSDRRWVTLNLRVVMIWRRHHLGEGDLVSATPSIAIRSPNPKMASRNQGVAGAGAIVIWVGLSIGCVYRYFKKSVFGADDIRTAAESGV